MGRKIRDALKQKGCQNLHVQRISPWFDMDFKPLMPNGRSNCFKIEQVEKRAITCDQLALLQSFFCSFEEADGVLGGWWNRSPYRKSLVIESGSLDLYQLVDWVINPSTAPAKCSFVELLAQNEQPPEWFISHWWGEPVRDFILCVQHHTQVRELPSTTAYWVCAYANNQHALGAEIVADPSQSSFARAMRIARGVLLVLDADAKPFTRVWCCYEESVAVTSMDSQRARLLLDIATTKDGKPEALTDGPTELDKKGEYGPDYAWEEKGKREIGFPTELVAKGLSVDIEQANASQQMDKHRILNAIAERFDQLDEIPVVSHAKYSEVNRRLAGIFAAASYRAAVAVGKDISERGPLPILKALRADEFMKELALSVGTLGDQFQDAHLNQLVISLPKYLVALSLDCNDTHITSTDELGKGLGKCNNLTSLTLFLNSTKISSVDELGKGLGLLHNLASLNLNFYGTKIVSVDELGKGLGLLQNLASLNLNFEQTEIISVDELGKGICLLTGLTSLSLNIGSTKVEPTSIDKLVQGLAKNTNLTSLNLDLSYCGQITSVDELGKGICLLTGLTSLSLNIAATKVEPTSIDQFVQGLANNTNLTSLTLILAGCKQITSVDELGKGLGNIRNLTSLTLRLRNTNVVSFNELHKGLCQQNGITSFNIGHPNGSDINSLDALSKFLS